MGFTTLKDVIPGAFAAAMLECLYPRGLNESAEPQNGDISLRLSCPVIDRMMPHWSKEERRLNIPPTATPTERLYLLSVPIRLSEDGVSSINPRGPAEPLTPDFQEIQRSLRDLALHPRLRCLLYENKILRHMGGIDNEIRRNDTQMIFSKTSLMYEQLPQRLAEDRGIDENQIKQQFQDSQASSDQKTMEILSQTKTDISHAGGTREGDAAIPGAINTGAALVLILVTGSSKDPVDFRNNGHGCNLPISRRRLQRDFNRAVLETKIGFLRTASNETVNNITQYNISDLWAQGVIHPESKRILSCIDLNMTLNQQEVEQLDLDALEFGRNAAGAVLTQIARYSPILNQSTLLSNEGFICAITYRINGSLALLFQASGIMNEIASCPVLKRDGSPCGCRLQDGDYTHFIGCKSHGLHLRPHNCMEDTLLATFQDALRSRIIGTDAFTCINDDKRPRVVGNLRTSIPCTLGEYNEQSNTFKQGNQADGLTIYNGHLEPDMFPLVTSTRPPNPNQPSDNSYPNRVRAFNTFTEYCRDNELKVEFWDVHFSQRSFNQLMRNETNKKKKYRDAWETFIARNDEETAQSRSNLRFTNPTSGGAPKISTFGMCLSGAFSTGAMEILTHLAKEKFPDPPTPDNPPGTYSYRVARHNGFADWWMRICQRNVFNCVAKSIMSGIKICKANAPTALPMDHTAEIHQTEPTWNYSHLAYVDPPRMVDLHPSNLNPNTNDTMGTMISTTLNTDPMTSSDVRPRLTSNNSSRCSELNSGPCLQDTFAPRKSSRNVRRQNMMLNIDGYKKFVRKCRRQQTYCDNLQILLQGRQDNPIHEVAFNELIENLKERNTIWSNMNENSDRNH